MVCQYSCDAIASVTENNGINFIEITHQDKQNDIFNRRKPN